MNDFDRMADLCLARVYEVRDKGLVAEHEVIAQQLRQVWNARGAADLSQLAEEARTLNWQMDDAVFWALARAIRNVDR